MEQLWLLWSLAGVAMEFAGGTTFTRWSVTRDKSGFWTVVGLLATAITHLVAQRFGCFGFQVC